MLPDCQANFRFHNIGQGLFYNGEIRSLSLNFKFSFIYDCGSLGFLGFKPLLNKQIDKVVEKNEGQLDLLVISHFDEDHINGIDRLLKKVKVQTVVIPYVTPLERLLLTVKNTKPSNKYYSFLLDPIEYIMRNGNVEEIIIIEGDKPFEEDEEVNNTPPLNNNSQLVSISLSENSSLKKTINIEEGKEYPENVSYLNHDGNIFVRDYWRFRFFNSKAQKENLNAFKDKLKELGLDVSSNKKVLEIIGDYVNRTKVKKAYKLIEKDINLTSLLLYHGPIEMRRKCLRNVIINSGLKGLFRVENRSLFIDRSLGHGCLLLGDINLNYKYNEFKTHFNKSFPFIQTVLVPHHGSLLSWNNQILSDIQAPCWIVSYGSNNNFKHPASNIAVEIRKEGRSFLKATEFSWVSHLYVSR
ncbi:hypothetical protein CW306_00515 [Bacillus sp. BA3]|uniref:hypothetical protein n=1 Tax=Bacillus sp. BA3 TaxID=2057910 RepID=UPI000C32A82E|nr:hypothetical protein [Bacillus sp. BA3]PKF90055.1 hypothetical protein CW306_00515 [Bacillus sp. BA3]